MTTRRKTLKVTVWSNTCERCRHSWESTGAAAPKACARCKSRYWNVPRGTLTRGPKPKK